jgi:4-hydroxy-tetrahydrodipicolinate synthase
MAVFSGDSIWNKNRYAKEADMNLSGLVVPIACPFADDCSVDEEMFIAHLEMLAGQGVERILVNGTTGEFFSLTDAERRSVFTLARNHFSGKIIFHAGGSSLEQTEIEAAWAIDNRADAIAAIVPYYMANADQQGIIDYFNRLRSRIEIPFILYNFPKHTQNPLTAEMLGRIDHFGMKDSSGDLSLVSATGHYYVGGDAKIIAAYKKGAYGFVSARANAFGRLYVELQRAIVENDGRAEAVQSEVVKLKNEMTGFKGIAKIKYAITKRLKGYPTRVRLPLVGLSDDEKSEMDRAIGSRMVD